MISGLFRWASPGLGRKAAAGPMGQTSSQMRLEGEESERADTPASRASEAWMRMKMRDESITLQYPDQASRRRETKGTQDIKLEAMENLARPFVEGGSPLLEAKSRKERKESRKKKRDWVNGVRSPLKQEVEERPVNAISEGDILAPSLKGKKEKKSKRKERKSQKRRGVFDIPSTPGPTRDEAGPNMVETLARSTNEVYDDSSRLPHAKSSQIEIHVSPRKDLLHFGSDDFRIMDDVISAPPPAHQLDDLLTEEEEEDEEKEEPTKSEILSPPPSTTRNQLAKDLLQFQDEDLSALPPARPLDEPSSGEEDEVSGSRDPSKPRALSHNGSAEELFRVQDSGFSVSPPEHPLDELPSDGDDFMKSTTPSVNAVDRYAESPSEDDLDSSRTGSLPIGIADAPSLPTTKDKGKKKVDALDHFPESQAERDMSNGGRPIKTSENKKKQPKKLMKAQISDDDPFQKAAINARIRAEEEREQASRQSTSGRPNSHSSSENRRKRADGSSATAEGNGSPLLITNGVTSILTRSKPVSHSNGTAKSQVMPRPEVVVKVPINEVTDVAGQYESSDDNSLVGELSQYHQASAQNVREDSIMRPPEDSGDDETLFSIAKSKSPAPKSKKRRIDTNPPPERPQKKARKIVKGTKSKSFKSSEFIRDSDTDLDFTKSRITSGNLPQQGETNYRAEKPPMQATRTTPKNSYSSKSPSSHDSDDLFVESNSEPELDSSLQLTTSSGKKRQLPAILTPRKIEELKINSKHDPKTSKGKKGNRKSRNSTASGCPRINGPFSTEERDALADFKEQYSSIMGIDDDKFTKLVHGNASDRHIAAFWDEAAQAVPYRDRQAIQKFCRNVWNKAEKDGKLTQDEDERLLELVERFKVGEKKISWAKVAAKMKRKPQELRDRWRNVLKDREERKTTRWSRQEIEALKEAMGECGARTLAERQAGDKNKASRNTRTDRIINWGVVSEMMSSKRNRAQCTYKWKRLKDMKAVSLRVEVEKAAKRLGLDLDFPHGRTQDSSYQASDSAVEEASGTFSQPESDELDDDDEESHINEEEEGSGEEPEHTMSLNLNAPKRDRRHTSSSPQARSAKSTEETQSNGLQSEESDDDIIGLQPAKKTKQHSAQRSREPSSLERRPQKSKDVFDENEESDEEDDDQLNGYIDDEALEDGTSEDESGAESLEL